MGKNVDHLQHVKSNVVLEGKPKLPQPSALVDGELAINYATGYETISIKNSSGDIVTFSSDNYYSEQKLGSGFTGENSGVTVTDALNNITIDVDQVIDSGTSASTNAVSTAAVYDKIVEDEEIWAITYNQLNSNKVEEVSYDSATGNLTFYSDSGKTSAITSVTISGQAGIVDQVIDSGTSTSTNAVSTSAVYGFVTSYTPSITVDQVLDDSVSASTNPVSSKAVYDAVTDNELVWTNAYVTLSGAVSSHTSNTSAHITSADRAKLDSITGNVGTMAYENASSYSSATEVNTALGGKADLSGLTGHTADTTIHFTTGDVQSQISDALTALSIASSAVTSMAGYTMAASGTPITSADTLNGAIGKLEKMIDEFKDYIEQKELAIAAAITDLNDKVGDIESILATI